MTKEIKHLNWKRSLIDSLPTLIWTLLWLAMVFCSMKYFEQEKVGFGSLAPVVLIFLILLFITLAQKLIPSPRISFFEEEY